MTYPPLTSFQNAYSIIVTFIFVHPCNRKGNNRSTKSRTYNNSIILDR